MRCDAMRCDLHRADDDGKQEAREREQVRHAHEELVDEDEPQLKVEAAPPALLTVVLYIM